MTRRLVPSVPAIVRLATVALLLAACNAAAPTPSASLARSPSTATDPSSPVPSPGASTSATPGPVAVLPGEPWLAYAWYPDVLYLVRPDGSDVHGLDIGPGDIPFSPAWSPDGDELVFVRRSDKASSIWTANADGSSASLLYDGNKECGDGVFWPSWSPDGTRLALVCYFTDSIASFTEVSVLDPVTKKRAAVVKYGYPMTIDNPISWSPDGSTLAFELITWDPTDKFITESLIATVPAGGGHPTTLTDPAVFAAHPDWSPDGKLIAFNTYDTGNMHGIEQPSNVFVIAPDGTKLHQLSTASVDGKMRLGQPFWSSDGTRIWVSVAYDWEKDSNGQPKNVLGWVDVATGAFHEVGTEGKRFRERPLATP